MPNDFRGTPPVIPIDLDDYAIGDDGRNYRLLSRISRTPSNYLQSGNPINTPRQRAFEDMIRQIATTLGSTRIPLYFLTPNGESRKLDDGCVGHAIANDVLFAPGHNGGDPSYVQLRQKAVTGKEDEQAGKEIERQKRWGEIASRPKQSEFSAAVRRNYGGICAVTGCSTPAALQAAHMRVSEGMDFNSASNGILLRSDIHALLDALLITFSPDGTAVEVSPLLDDLSFAFLRTCKITRPASGLALSSENIQHHRQRFRENAIKLGI